MKSAGARERLKPPQRPRKASQTARGFNRELPPLQVAGLRARGTRPHSAQADFVSSRPRIHSPGAEPASTPCRERLKPPLGLRKASQTARGFNRELPPRQAVGQRARGTRPQSPQADFVLSQPRIHSPGAEPASTARRERLKPPLGLRKASQTTRGFNGELPHPPTEPPHPQTVVWSQSALRAPCGMKGAVQPPPGVFGGGASLSERGGRSRGDCHPLHPVQP